MRESRDEPSRRSPINAAGSSSRPATAPISSAAPANSTGSRPRKIERHDRTNNTRRRTLLKSAASPRHLRAAALMPCCSENATTSSADASEPGRRAEKQSGKALKVILQSRQYQREIRVPTGVLRP